MQAVQAKRAVVAATKTTGLMKRPVGWYGLRIFTKAFVHPDMWAAFIQKFISGSKIALLFVKGFGPHLRSQAE